MGSKSKGDSQGRFQMPESHITISRTCLLYLLLPGIDIPSESSLAEKKQYQHLAYAAAYWPLLFVSQDATKAVCDCSNKEFQGKANCVYCFYSKECLQTLLRQRMNPHVRSIPVRPQAYLTMLSKVPRLPRTTSLPAPLSRSSPFLLEQIMPRRRPRREIQLLAWSAS